MAEYANFFYKMHMMKKEVAERFYQIIGPLVKSGGIYYASGIDSLEHFARCCGEECVSLLRYDK